MAPPLAPDLGPKQWMRGVIGHDANRGRITSLAWHPGGSRLASGDEHGGVRVIHVVDPAVPPADHPSGSDTSIVGLDISRAGDRMAAIGQDGHVRVWDLDIDGSPQRFVDTQVDAGSGVHFVFDDRKLLVTVGNELTLLEPVTIDDPAHSRPLWPEGDRPPANRVLDVVAVDANTLALVLADGSGQAMVVTTTDGGSSYRRIGLGGAGPVKRAALDASLTIVGVETEDGQLHQIFYQAAEMELRHDLDADLEDIAFDHITHDLYTLDVAGRLVARNVDGQRVLDIAVDQELGTDATVLAVDGPSKSLATGHVNGTATSWIDGSSHINSALLPPPPGETIYEARPAEGVMLTHEQSWAMEGIALGELLHGVSLAPGEITQLAVTSHGQSLMQDSADTVTQRERIDAGTFSTGSLDQSESASAGESNVGLSSASASSSTSQVGGGLFFASGGGSHTTTSAVQASMSVGHRDVSDASSQALHQQAHSHANQNRQRYSSAVREVSEHESQEMQTRVVANYNHMHALNLQFYEVVQVQRLRTKVVDAHRLLFVPVATHEVGITEIAQRLLDRYPAELESILRQLGEGAAALCVDYLFARKEASIEIRQEQLNRLWNRTNKASGEVRDLEKEAAAATTELEDATKELLTARDHYRTIEIFGFWTHHEAQTRINKARTRLEAARRTNIAVQASLERARARKLQLVRIVRSITTFLGVQPPDFDATPTEAPAESESEESGSGEPTPDPAPGPEPPTLDSTMLHGCVERLADVMDRHSPAINHGLWTRMDASQWAGLLQRHTYLGRPIGAEVDPHPVAYAGDYIGFRWNFDEPADELRFRGEHVGKTELTDAIPMPTGGIFGEAVLGDSNAADKIDITRFWNWSDSLPPIRPAEIGALEQKASEDLPTPTRPDAPASTVNLGPITFPQLSSSIPAITGALSNQDLFQDLGSTKAASSLALSAVDLSAKGADAASDLAASNFKRFLKFQSAMADLAIDHQKKAAMAEKQLDPTMAGAAINAADTDGDGQLTGDERPSRSAGGGSGGGGSGGGRTLADGSVDGSPDGSSSSASEGAASDSGGAGAGPGTGSGSGSDRPSIEFARNVDEELDHDSGGPPAPGDASETPASGGNEADGDTNPSNTTSDTEEATP